MWGDWLAFQWCVSWPILSKLEDMLHPHSEVAYLAVSFYYLVTCVSTYLDSGVTSGDMERKAREFNQPTGQKILLLYIPRLRTG